MTIKKDKRAYSICIVSGSEKDNHYKHLDGKYNNTCKKCTGNPSLACDTCPNNHKNGLYKALKEGQRLSNKTGRKVTVSTSCYNIYPDKEVKNENR